MNVRDPKIQKYIMLGLVVLGLHYVYFFLPSLPFGYKAKAAEIDVMKVEYGKLSSEINQARRLAADLERVEALHQETQRKWEIANELLPTQTDMAGLLRAITVAGHSAGVDFVGFEPGDSQNFEYYAENPIQVSVVGGYHEVGAFYGELARLTRLVTVRMPKLESLRGGDEDERVRASCTAVAYSVTGDHVRAAAGSSRGAEPRGGLHGSAAAKRPAGKSGKIEG